MLLKFLAYKVLPGVIDDMVRRAKVRVDLAESKHIPGVLCGYVLQPAGGLESSSFVDYMQNWTAVNVHDVYKYRVIEVEILSQGELESAWGTSVFLAKRAELGELIKGLFGDIMARTL